VIASDRQGRILRLALLAPDIVEAILEGRANTGLALEKLERPLPASWEEQRDCIGSPGCREPFGQAVS
jgi:hypothetical protein